MATQFVQKILQKTTALLALSALMLPAMAQELTARQQLEAMKTASQQLNYEFSFVQSTPSNIDSLRYRHIQLDGKTYAQLVSLDGAPQEIIQRDNLISYFQPNFQAFTIQSSHISDDLPSILRSNVAQLEKYYDLVNTGRNRIADRLVQTIRILPKDDFRYQYVVFIDEQNHLLMRADMLDREGNLLEQFRVVSLYVGDELNELAQYIHTLQIPPLLIDKEKNSKPKFTWQPSWLPQGFKLVNQSIETDGQDKIETQLYSDGLFSFKLYVSSKILPNEQDNTWKQGGYTIYSDTLADKEVTLIGQLPISTAKRIVQDLIFKK